MYFDPYIKKLAISVPAVMISIHIKVAGDIQGGVGSHILKIVFMTDRTVLPKLLKSLKVCAVTDHHRTLSRAETGVNADIEPDRDLHNIFEEDIYMQYECKITVIDTKVFSELQEKYLADPKSGSQSRISGTALMMLIRGRRLWTPESKFPI